MEELKATLAQKEQTITDLSHQLYPSETKKEICRVTKINGFIFQALTVPGESGLHGVHAANHAEEVSKAKVGPLLLKPKMGAVPAVATVSRASSAAPTLAVSRANVPIVHSSATKKVTT